MHELPYPSSIHRRFTHRRFLEAREYKEWSGCPLLCLLDCCRRRQTACAHCRYGKPIDSDSAFMPRVHRVRSVHRALAAFLPSFVIIRSIGSDMELRDEWIVGSASVEASPALPRFLATNRTAI